jgi:DNA-binding response OmpR family regulator
MGASYIVQSFMTVVVGGVGNVWGTLAGAALIGVLHHLMRHAGTVISKDDLSRSVLGRRLTPYDRALDVHISHVRKKLAGSEIWRNRIQAVRGIGYQLLVPR